MDGSSAGEDLRADARRFWVTTAVTALFLMVLLVSAVSLVTGDAESIPSGAPLAWLIVFVIALVAAGIDRTRAWLDLRRRRRERDTLKVEWETRLRASGRWQ